MYKIEANAPIISSIFLTGRRLAGRASLINSCCRFVKPVFFNVAAKTRSLILVILAIGCVHPNPGPRNLPPPPPSRILSWNCNGLGNSAAELRDYLLRNNVLVACIQETKLGPDSRLPSFPGYAFIRKDRGAGGGGLVTLVHHSLSYVTVDSPINDGVSEVIIVKDSIAGKDLHVANVYVPPASSTNIPPLFRLSFAPLFAFTDIVILGDVNGHNEEWSRGAPDTRGDRLAAEVDDFNFAVLNNPDISTRPCSDTSPDVAFAPTSWALSFDWIASTALNSDHLPISLLIADERSLPCGGRTYVNFRAAKW